ncbi:MAG: GNAT family N-acetyltransferase [Candidatus Hodarchaeales archaeon]
MIVKITIELQKLLKRKQSAYGKISPYTKSFVQLNSKNNVSCLIILKKEPSVFLSSIGTVFASLIFSKSLEIDWKEINSFFVKNDIQFVTTKIKAKDKETNKWLIDQEFSLYESSIIMTRKNLDNDCVNDHRSQVKLHSVYNEATCDYYFDLVLRCLKESPDERAKRILDLQKKGDKVFKYCRLKTWAIMHKAFIYSEEGVLQGFTELNLPKQSISNIGVLPEYRNRGVGSKLLKLAILKAQRENFQGLQLRVSEKNRIAIKMYKNHAFLETDRLNHYWKKIEDN